MRAIDITCAEIGTVSSRVDGSIKSYFITPELDNMQRATMLGLHGKNARITIIPRDVSSDGMDVVETEAEPKSKCERLRAVLYVLWHQQYNPETAVNGVPRVQFQDFYNSKMEGIIDKIKERLK